MSVESNKKVVRRWNEEIIGRRQVEAFAEVLDENYTLHTLNLHGIEVTRRYFSGLFNKYPNWEVTIEDMVGERESVAIRMTYTDSGKPIMEVISFYRLSGGKIVDDWYCSREIK